MPRHNWRWRTSSFFRRHGGCLPDALPCLSARSRRVMALSGNLSVRRAGRSMSNGQRLFGGLRSPTIPAPRPSARSARVRALHGCRTAVRLLPCRTFRSLHGAGADADIALSALHNKAGVYGHPFHTPPPPDPARHRCRSQASRRRDRLVAVPAHLVDRTCIITSPSLPCVVPGGGPSARQTRWIAAAPVFFRPVKVLSASLPPASSDPPPGGVRCGRSGSLALWRAWPAPAYSHCLAFVRCAPFGCCSSTPSTRFLSTTPLRVRSIRVVFPAHTHRIASPRAILLQPSLSRVTGIVSYQHFLFMCCSRSLCPYYSRVTQ